MAATLQVWEPIPNGRWRITLQTLDRFELRFAIQARLETYRTEVGELFVKNLNPGFPPERSVRVNRINFLLFGTS